MGVELPACLTLRERVGAELARRCARLSYACAALHADRGFATERARGAAAGLTRARLAWLAPRLTAWLTAWLAGRRLRPEGRLGLLCFCDRGPTQGQGKRRQTTE